ncbi:MAG: hypothetical protein LLG20_05370 [Acidobacteriales bacterium]|nr:hypothetical protein [Terriglobales bacterium]
MKRLFTLALLLGGALWVGAADKPRVSRSALTPLERSFDRRLDGWSVDEPVMLLGTTRGVYLEGYGAVFTAEMNLMPGPTISPFQPIIRKESIVRVHQRKVERLPRLREQMKEMLVASAQSLDTVPLDEKIVVGVTLFHYSWEDVSGVPAQIVMQAQRRLLLDYSLKHIDRAALDAGIRTEDL